MTSRDRRPLLAVSKLWLADTIGRIPIFALVLPLVASLALLPGEFTYYKRWLDLGPDEIGLRIAVAVAVLSKTLAVLYLALFGIAMLGRAVSPGRLRAVAVVSSVLVLGFLLLDLEFQRATGNGVGRFLPYLFDPETFRWAGDGLDPWPTLLGVASKLLLAFVPACLLAWVADRWAGRAASRASRTLGGAIVGCIGTLLLLSPLLQRVSGPSVHLYHLGEQMPWSWNPGSGAITAQTDAIERAAQAVFDRLGPRLAESADFARRFDAVVPTRRPDILVIVVESLRHDALEPRIMPNVWAASQRGVRFDSHYANSNASHYGLFAILYGRSPLTYYETLDAGEPPTLVSLLREWGYSTHHLTCSAIHWREMHRFLGARDFAVERMGGDTLDACDQNLAARAAALLAPGDRPPRFVLGFMMSTHFGYHYPDESEVFTPAAGPPNALELEAGRDSAELLNRYRNSAHHIDATIGTLLEHVDLEDTLVVVTGDHGESIFDDGTVAHSSRLSEIQTRVPLAMFGSGLDGAIARPGPTDHTDLLPTILARLGIDRGRVDSLPGRDLSRGSASPFVALVHARARPGGPDRIALASSDATYSFRLDRQSGELDFLGRLRPDGRPSREARTTGSDTRVIRWLEQYLRSLVDQRPPIESTPAASPPEASPSTRSTEPSRPIS